MFVNPKLKIHMVRHVFVKLFMVITIRAPERGVAEAHPSANRIRAGSPFWIVLSIPTMMWIIVSGALFNFNSYAVNVFFDDYIPQ